MLIPYRGFGQGLKSTHDIVDKLIKPLTIFINALLRLANYNSIN